MIWLWLKRTVFLLVVLNIMLPSGSIYGFSAKVYLSLFVIFSLLAATVLEWKVPRIVFLTAVGVTSFLVFSLTVALINGNPPDSIRSETQAFLSVFATVLPVMYLIDKGIVASHSFFAFVVRVSVAHSIVKAFVEFLLMAGFISESGLRSWIPEVFGADILLLDYGLFFRINTSGDFILPVAIFILMALQSRSRSAPKQIVYLGLLLFAVFLTYSRYLWLYGAIAVVLGYLATRTGNHESPSLRIAVTRALKASVGGLLLGILLIFSGGIDSFLDRFTGNSAISSDEQRVEMLYPLLEGFSQNPGFGKGMGGYVEDVIRVERLPWNYELEWLSFAMQFGIVGIIALIGAAIWPLLYMRIGVAGWCSGVMYLLWVGVGIFNSFLLTSAAGVVFATFIVLGKHLWEIENGGGHLRI